MENSLSEIYSVHSWILCPKYKHGATRIVNDNLEYEWNVNCVKKVLKKIDETGDVAPKDSGQRKSVLFKVKQLYSSDNDLVYVPKKITRVEAPEERLFCEIEAFPK